jgi:integrase
MKGNIYHYKDGYQVRFGKHICRRFGRDLIGAERYLNWLRYQTDENIFDPRDHQVKRNPMGLKKQGDKWLKLKKKQVKPRSYANLARYMGYFYNYIGKSTNIKLIGYAQIEDFLFSLKVSDKTRANAKSAIHSFLKWVSKRERIPMPDFPETPFELGWRNIIDLETQSQIISKLKDISFHINPRIWFAVHTLSTYISIRPLELINIKENQVDRRMGAFIIPSPKEKNPKIVYILEQEISFIRTHLPTGLPKMYFFRHPPGLKGAVAGQRFGNRYLYKWWKRACSDLGIEGVDLYGGTRHSTATALGRICTPEEVRDATGHTSKAFERYFQNKQARALKVTQKIKELRGEVINYENRKGAKR